MRVARRGRAFKGTVQLQVRRSNNENCSTPQIKANLSAYLKSSATSPVVVTRNGKAVAVLLGVSDDEELERLLLAHSRKLSAILDAAERRIENGAGIGHDEFWQKAESTARPGEAKGNGKKRRAKR